MYKCLRMNTQVFINKVMTSWKCLQMTPATPEFCPQLSIHKYSHSEPQQPKEKPSMKLVSASSFWPLCGNCDVGQRLFCLLNSSQRKGHHSTAAGGVSVSLGRMSFGCYGPRSLSRAKDHVSLCINRSWFQDTEGKSRESDISSFSPSASLLIPRKKTVTVF